MRSSKSFFSAFITIGISSIFVVIGVMMLNNSNNFRNNGIAVDAECTGYDHESDPDTGESFYPQVKFTTADGEAVHTQLAYGTGNPEYEIGEGIPILYLPENPSGDVMINDPFWLTTFPWIFLGIGIAFQLIAIIIILVVVRKMRKSESPNKARNFFDNTNDSDESNPFTDRKDGDNKNPFIID